MKSCLSILLLLLVCTTSAQEPTASLLLQSPDGKTVKLLWVLKAWDKSLDGFDLKKRSGRGDWQKLNKAPILPEISLQKDFTIVDTDPVAAGDLKAVLVQKIGAGEMKEISHTAYIEKLRTDPDAIKAVAMMTALNYQLALINGFAFVDRNTSAGRWEYGLFPTGSNKALATASWQFGERPDLDLITDITARKTSVKNKIQLVWTVDSVKAKAAHLSGFNIYREARKLNQAPVMSLNSVGLYEFSWFDSLEVLQKTQYNISTVSIFGIESALRPFTYDPAMHAQDYQAPELIEPLSEVQGTTAKVRLSWTLPKSLNQQLKGFRMYRADLPAEPRTISELLPPNARSFDDKTPAVIPSYVRYQLQAIYQDGTIMQSGERLFYYAPALKPSKPQGLKATWTKKADKLVVDLSWNAPAADDSLTDYYQLYASDAISGKLYLQADRGRIEGNTISYTINYGKGQRYDFAVSAIGKNLVESELSDTASVRVPSQQLPYPRIENVAVDSNRVKLFWDYPEIADLKGFRVFQNGNMVASEFELNKAVRQFSTPSLKWNTTYGFTIQAVTETGVESPISVTRSVTTDTKKR